MRRPDFRGSFTHSAKAFPRPVKGGYVTVRSPIEVGDLVRVRRDGRSAAAKKYAGRDGRVTMRGPGLDRIVLDVRIDENNFDTVFEEEDLSQSLSVF
jgi:hypothetical protein